METTPEDSSNKKQKLDAADELPPEYGSQQYWEERYSQHRQTNRNHNDDNDAYHEWYFSYEDLAPLIMPLIFGGRSDNQDDDDKNHSESDKETDNGNKDERSSDKSKPASDETNRPSVAAATGDDESDDIEEQQVDDTDEEELGEREGLVKKGPISILEVGCGDVPLGRDLCVALRDECKKRNASNDNIAVKEIVCCDYSPTVIETCIENQRKELESIESKSQDASTGGVIARAEELQVNYVTADARKLPFLDDSFHLILEKGTLDAMLSDKDNGKQNCIMIMTQCARVLKEGGKWAFS